MNNLLKITIDPGKSGAIAFSYNDKVTCYYYPENTHDLVRIFKENITSNNMAILEKVHAMPGQGVTSMFSFGENYGIYLGILSALSIPFILVSPQKWQKIIGNMPKDKQERKNYIKQYVSSLYPHIKVTLKNADALAMISIFDKLK